MGKYCFGYYFVLFRTYTITHALYGIVQVICIYVEIVTNFEALLLHFYILHLRINFFLACSDDVTNIATINASSSISSETGQNAFIYSRITWCASPSDATRYLDVDLKVPRMVTGIGIQGDSNNDQWVKTFKFSHGLNDSSLQDTGKVSVVCIQL